MKSRLLLAVAAAAGLSAAVAVFFFAGRETPAASIVAPGADSRPAIAVPPADADDPSAVSSVDPAPLATSAAASRGLLPAGTFLPIERKFFVDGQVNLITARDTLRTRQFDKDLDTLEAQMARDPAAMDMASTYRQAISRQLMHAAGPGAPDRFACGLGLCMGTLRAQDGDTWYGRWQNDFQLSNETPHNVMLDYRHSLGGGAYEYRFLFVNDPGINTIRLPPG